MVIAELDNIGFTGYETGDNYLHAFIPEPVFDESAFEAICKKYGVSAQRTVIPPANWNEIWESGFEPVLVDDFCFIRAAFHPPGNGRTQFEVEITPKMSFGTGHHATTFMMVQLMREIDFASKTVCDFGTGTGVLAILAEKMGATEVLAVDYDELCMENAAENIAVNQCHHIQTLQKDALPEGRWQVILANINLNVLCANMEQMARSLAGSGELLLSGILATDKEVITRSLTDNNMKINTVIQKDQWLAISATVCC